MAKNGLRLFIKNSYKTIKFFYFVFQKDKKNLKSNFPNLPYLKNGERVVTESFAIMMYLCIHTKRMDLFGRYKLIKNTIS